MRSPMSLGTDSKPLLLDAAVPIWQHRERHSILVQASPDETWDKLLSARAHDLKRHRPDGAGLFRSDPVFGYPTDLPVRLRAFTLSGHLHDLFSAIFFSVPAACVILYRRATKNEERIILAAALALFVLTFAFATAGFRQVAFFSVAGLMQRVAISANLVVIAGYCRREARLRQP